MKIFYGWPMVAFAALAMSLSGPGQTVGVSVFVDPMVDGLDISRTALSTAYLVGTLVGAAVLPFIGQALDRFGVRKVMAIIGALFGGVLVAMSVVTSIVGLTAGFIGIRLLGQGALTLAATTSIALWFSKKRGLAMGILSAAGGVGMTTVPLITEGLITDFGWRTVWVIEGITIWLVVVPLALFAIRNRPSDIGQHVDGDPLTPAVIDQGWGVTRKAAARTGFFWVVTAAVTTSAMLATAVAFHQIDLLGSRGLTPTEAAANFLPQIVATLLVAIGIGALADRVAARILLAVSMILLAGGLVWGTLVTPGWSAIAFGMLIGASAGALRVIEAADLPKFFGTTHIGAIRGLVTSIAIAGSALGPVLFSLGHDVTGDYNVVLLIGAVIPTIVAAAVFLTRTPHPRVLDVAYN